MKNLQMKIDKFLWAFMWLLPFVTYWLSGYSVAEGGQSFLLYLDTFDWSFISNAINSAWQLAFGTDCVLSVYLSYLVAVEVAHVMFDVIVFIPRFAHSIIERSTTLWQKD